MTIDRKIDVGTMDFYLDWSYFIFPNLKWIYENRVRATNSMQKILMLFVSCAVRFQKKISGSKT